MSFFDKVWHPPHDLDAIDHLMTEDYTITTAGKTIHGRKAFKEWVRVFQQQLLEAQTQNLSLFCNEDSSMVVSRWVCSGKNNGLFGLKADLSEISFTGIAIWAIRDGRFSACWVERSAHELYQQLTGSQEGSAFV